MKVHDFGLAFCREHDVRALDVPVENALVMGGREPGRDLEGEFEGLMGRYCAVVDSGGQRLAFDESHVDVGQAVHFLGFVDRTDMRMIKGRRGASFPQETLFGFGLGAQLGRQELQSDGPPQVSVMGFENNPHASAADLAFDLVLAGEEATRLKQLALDVDAQGGGGPTVRSRKPAAARAAEGLAVRIDGPTARALRHGSPGIPLVARG